MYHRIGMRKKIAWGNHSRVLDIYIRDKAYGLLEILYLGDSDMNILSEFTVLGMRLSSVMCRYDFLAFFGIGKIVDYISQLIYLLIFLTNGGLMNLI